MFEPTTTICGNLTGDPELRRTPSGSVVTNFTVAATPRHLDRSSGQWIDGDALFLRCSVWGQQGEHTAEGLARGSRVIVTGRLRQRQFETREGDKRSVVELDVDEIGPSLRYGTAAGRRGQPTPAHTDTAQDDTAQDDTAQDGPTDEPVPDPGAHRGGAGPVCRPGPVPPLQRRAGGQRDDQRQRPGAPAA